MEFTSAIEHLFSMLPQTDRDALKLLLREPGFTMLSYSITMEHTQVVLKSRCSIWTIQFEPAITKD